MIRVPVGAVRSTNAAASKEPEKTSTLAAARVGSRLVQELRNTCNRASCQALLTHQDPL